MSRSAAKIVQTQLTGVEVTRRKIRTLSLFSGAGGLDIGFHEADFEIIAAVEIESDYCATLQQNTGVGNFFNSNVRVICEDVRRFDPSPFKDIGIECVIGGPPCQTFSAAGRRSGGVLGTTDERGQLFLAYCDILRVIQPQVFVFENVYGLPGANGGEPWREIVAAFSELGYKLQKEVIDAADYGVPQHRERLLMVGYREGNYDFPLPTHGPDSRLKTPLVSVLDAIGDLQDPDEPFQGSLGGRYGHLLPLVPEGLNYSFFTKEMGYPEPVFAWRSKFHDLLYKVDRNTPTRTIKAQPGKFTGPFHWKNRHFTVPELKRLQTFPDAYDIAGSYNKIVEQIGNSVPPRLAKVIAISVREQLFDNVLSLTYPVRPANFRSTFRRRQRERTHYYKLRAASEIKARFGDLQEELLFTSHFETYFLSFETFFERERFSQRPNVSDIDAKAVYTVTNTISDGLGQMSFARERSNQHDLVDIQVEITGLNKYLRNVDALNIEAQLYEDRDYFALWSAIEELLVAHSNFYTLIDIYGHYANRGDVVKIKTDIVGVDTNSFARAIKFFGDSRSCGGFIHKADLLSKLRLSSDELSVLIRRLREIRFDVRTWETHPTVPSNYILCTYPFPLLGEKVHLRRRVRTVDQVSNDRILKQLDLSFE